MLCLWCRLAAVALLRPLAWELPYATGATLKKKKKKKRKRKQILKAGFGGWVVYMFKKHRDYVLDWGKESVGHR